MGSDYYNRQSNTAINIFGQVIVHFLIGPIHLVYNGTSKYIWAFNAKESALNLNLVKIFAVEL